MQENFEINAMSRSEKGKGASRRYRKDGLVPGILYGGKSGPEMFVTKQNELLLHLEHEAFYSHILTIKLDKKKHKVVLKDLQRHPAKPHVMHLDLLRVKDTDKIKMNIPLHFLNEELCPGIKSGGVVNRSLTEIEVLCFAKNLPEFIEVDMVNLNIGDSIKLDEVSLPEGVEVTLLNQTDGSDISVVAINAAKVVVEDLDEEAPAETTEESDENEKEKE